MDNFEDDTLRPEIDLAKEELTQLILQKRNEYQDRIESKLQRLKQRRIKREQSILKFEKLHDNNSSLNEALTIAEKIQNWTVEYEMQNTKLMDYLNSNEKPKKIKEALEVEVQVSSKTLQKLNKQYKAIHDKLVLIEELAGIHLAFKKKILEITVDYKINRKILIGMNDKRKMEIISITPSPDKVQEIIANFNQNNDLNYLIKNME